MEPSSLEIVSKLLVLFLGPVILIATFTMGEPDQGEMVPYGLIPGLGWVFAFVSVGMMVHRVWESRGKCIIGHSFEHVHDSEKAKWANGRMPMAISRSGYDNYVCRRCSSKRTTRWSAY